MHCFGSFLLQAMFLSLQVFAFKGQNMKLTVKMLFTCILCFDLRDYLFRVTSICVSLKSPASSDGQNSKAAWLFISRYIELYEVCHPPVLMDKTLELRDYIFCITSNCMR